MRKNNPYYSGRGRPSENATDWEWHENLRQDFNKVMGSKIETTNIGNVVYGGMIWETKTDVYERGYCVNFSMNFETLI